MTRKPRPDGIYEVQQPAPAACKCCKCETPAVTVWQKRSGPMPAPGFYYYCPVHAVSDLCEQEG